MRSKILMGLLALALAGCASNRLAYGPVQTENYIRWCAQGDVIAAHAAMMAGLADGNQGQVYANLQRERNEYLHEHRLPACPE